MTEFFGQPPVASGGGRGFVRPRASRQPGGAALPLLKLIEPYLGKRGVIYIVGPAGSGKTWALHYLGATLEKNDRKWLIDQPQERYWELKEMPPLAIVTTLPRKELDAIAVLHLAPWTEDDLIEFLLNGGHRGRVTSVMARLRDGPDRSALAGSPQLWRIVLEEMIADDNVRTCGAALRKRLVGLLDERVRDGLLAMSLAAARAGEPIKVEDLPRFVPEELSRLVRHPIVCRLLAAERIVTDLERFRGERDFHQTLSREVVRETGRLLPERPAALENLQKLLARRDSRADAMGASVMLVVDSLWRPSVRRALALSGAQLSRARWTGIDLRDANLVQTEFNAADLARARLDGAVATGADFGRALLAGASMTAIRATEANFAAADLSGASAVKGRFSSSNFSGAVMRRVDFSKAILCQCQMNGADLREAILCGADLAQAQLAEADFTGADLTDVELSSTDLSGATWGATRFRRALLQRCNMEGLDIPGAQFAEAKLNGAYLTGSRMPGGDFRGADLRNTGLADIDWPGADLRDADLHGCSFHLGSSRSGLVGSVIPCEGSKTGFYTDDYNDQDFKAPEEIRKANLCGADLRGANIEGVDFYLVDLRGAKYSSRQAEHLARCGAILESRVR